MKPEWKDGLFVMPQHFQMFDEHVEHGIARRAMAVGPYLWGLRKLELDEEALSRGLFSVRHLEAILPDGSWVEIGSQHSVAPATVSLPAPVPRSEPIPAYVAVPDDSSKGTETYAGERGVLGSRWLRRRETRQDAFGSAQECQVEGLELNVQLFARGQPPAGYVSLKVAELRAREDASLAISGDYIPPLMRIGASRALCTRLGRLAAAAASRRAALAARYRSRVAALVEFGPKDVAVFWYLFALNGAIPTLAHLATTPDTHPLDAYLSLAQIAGQLSTFLPRRAPAETRPYDHLDLSGTLEPLLSEVESLIGLVLAEAYRSIPLQLTQRALHVARGLEENVLRRSELYLMAGGQVPFEVLREGLSKSTVVTAESKVAELVRGNLPGLELEVDLQPPAALPVKADHVYLRLVKQGPHWEAIRQGKTIAIFQPVEHERIEIELLAVEEAQ